MFGGIALHDWRLASLVATALALGWAVGLLVRQHSTSAAQQRRELAGWAGGGDRRTLARELPGEASVPGWLPASGQRYDFAELSELVANVRSAGLVVDLRLTPPDASLEPELLQVVYRVVQESLTNVIRHAETGRAWVAVAPDEHRLRVRIADRGQPSQQAGSGLGLAGMHERVRSVGGWLHAGPRPGGGFLVEAVLPLAPVRSAAASR